jgi:hypothetical protein
MKRKIGCLILFIYCQFAVGLCGYLFYFTINDPSPDAHMLLGKRLGLIIAPFLAASIFSALSAPYFVSQTTPREYLSKPISAITRKVKIARDYFSPN